MINESLTQSNTPSPLSPTRIRSTSRFGVSDEVVTSSNPPSSIVIGIFQLGSHRLLGLSWAIDSPVKTIGCDGPNATMPTPAARSAVVVSVASIVAPTVGGLALMIVVASAASGAGATAISNA